MGHCEKEFSVGIHDYLENIHSGWTEENKKHRKKEKKRERNQVRQKQT